MTDPYTLSHNHGSWLLSNATEANETRGGNPRYQFTVRRRSPTDPWFAANIEEASPEVHGFGIEFRAPWSVFDVPLQMLVRDPTFQITESKESAEGELTIAFKIDGLREGVPRLKGLTGGQFTCSPLQSWAVQSYDVEGQRGQTGSMAHFAAEVTYGSPSPDFLNLVHTIYRTYWTYDGVNFDNTWENDIQSRKCDLPTEAFTLSAFGLPEPVLKAQRIRFWVFVNVAAIGLIVVAIWFGRRADSLRRR